MGYPDTRYGQNQQNTKEEGFGPKEVGYVVAALMAVFFLFGSFTIIGSGNRGVVTHFGKVQDEVLDEGIHLKLPFVTSIHKISVRIQKSDTKTEAASKDMQKVTAEVALNWHVDPKTVNHMYQTTGDEDDVVERIINPAVGEVLKAATAKMTAEEILTKRTELKSEIDKLLTARLATYNVLVNDISLVNLDFTEQFNKAVEAKQVAEQQAKQAVYTAQQAKAQAEGEINAARGRAEAQRLTKQTLTKEILQQQAIAKWNGAFPQYMGSGALPFINLKAE